MKKKHNYFKKNMNNYIKIIKQKSKTKNKIFINKIINLCKNLYLFYQLLNSKQKILS